MANDERKKKIGYKINLKSHLQELNCFTVRTMSESDLVPLDQTKEILDRSKQLREAVPNKFTIPFEEKKSFRFKNYIKLLQDANSSGVYVWINRTNDCGSSIIKSLFDLKWNFDFECSRHGMLILVTTDLQDRILFDFYEEDDERLLDIEVSGANWPKITW
jgi:hypothetical protein